MSDRTAELAVAIEEVLGGEVSGLVRLSGGASRETWSFDVTGPDGVTALVLQRRRPGTAELSGGVGLEAELLRAAAGAGVPVPGVVASGDGATGTTGQGFGAPWMICERVGGDALPRHLLGDEAFAGVRGHLAFDCGAALARIHAVDAGRFAEQLAPDDQIARLRDVLDLTSGARPALEAGFRRLQLDPPPDRPTALVHGDFRTGNLLVRPDDADRPGLAAVLDWELAHLGNPVEDLGWFCVRAWRFGADGRAGGFGPARQLLDGYESVSGERVSDAELDWWELFGTLRWGVICAVQAESHLSGAVRSVELATIGRRACENEYDALGLLGASFPPPPPTSDAALPISGAAAPTIHDRPTAVELIAAVRDFLRDDVMASTEGRVRFHARVAANALAIAERELTAGDAPGVDHRARLAALGVTDDADLAAALRRGDLDDRWPEVRDALAATVLDKLRVSNPTYVRP